jgi:hypothetical protein
MSGKNNIRRVRIKLLICSKCHNVFPIARKKSHNRSTGHIKHLYCPVCEKVTEHVEHDDNAPSAMFFSGQNLAW